MAKRGGFLARVITVDRVHVGNRAGRDEYTRVVFIKEGGGGIVPMVKRGDETILGPVMHEHGADKGEGRGYGSFFKKDGSFNVDQAEKVVTELRAHVWMRERKRIEMTPLNYYHQDLPDGVNADFAQNGIKTLYNTGKRHDKPVVLADKLVALFDLTQSNKSGIGGSLKNEKVDLYIDRMNQEAVDNIINRLNESKHRFNVEKVGDSSLKISDKYTRDSQPITFNFIYGRW